MADNLPRYQISNCILCNSHSMHRGRFCCALSSHRSCWLGCSFMSVVSSARTQAIKVILGNLTQCLQFFSRQVKPCGDDRPYSLLQAPSDYLSNQSTRGFTQASRAQVLFLNTKQCFRSRVSDCSSQGLHSADTTILHRRKK